VSLILRYGEDCNMDYPVNAHRPTNMNKRLSNVYIDKYNSNMVHGVYIIEYIRTHNKL